MGRIAAHIRQHKHVAWATGVAVGLCLTVAAACVVCCASGPDAALVSRVDSLNAQAYLCRYVCPDSALRLARGADRLSEDYPDGRAEALNHQMSIAFLRLDYEESVRLYERLGRSTNNQIELLAGDVNMMRICLQTAQNRLFFDYCNRANERIRRIYEELGEVRGRNRERLFCAETEFHLVCAGNYLRLMQEQEAENELAMIDEDGYVRKDKAMQTFYYYLNGLACLNTASGKGAALADAFDYLLTAYSLADRYDYAYFRSLAGLSLARLFVTPGGYAAAESLRKKELNYVHSLLADTLDSSQTESPACFFSEELAKECLSEARRDRLLLVEIEACRALGDVMMLRGDYNQALNDYEAALSCLNRHHGIYYPNDKGERLKSYDDGQAQPVDMLWTKSPDTQTLPNSLTALRERLSLAYSALNDKQKSDYNRNLYLDLLDFTRQDKSLESRLHLVAQNNRLLNMLLVSFMLLTLVLAVTARFYARKWEKRRAKQQALLNDISRWFMDVAFTKPESQLKQTLEAYPWMKREIRILRKVLRPYMEWAEKNRMVSDSLKEEQLQLHEDYLRSERQISLDKRRNIQKRAKVSLVHSIMPFIDRILYTLRRMERTAARDRGALGYVSELAEQIERYNKTLAEWITTSRGELELTVESFPLQELFRLLEKGGYGFRKKGVQLDIRRTDLWVKADKGLTFFMLNTLADNARKFTPPGGTVTIQAREADGAVEVEVSDTGCGLSAEDVDLIMSSKIYDAGRIGLSSPASRQGKGSGFGLLNCKGIIEKYRKSGDLFNVCRFHVESEVGKGSRFSFRLPKGTARALAVLLLLAQPGGRAHASDGLADTEPLTKAVLYADSVYFANIDGDYERSMALADSALRYVNLYYRQILPDECACKQLSVDGGDAGELEWLELGVKADYNLIMSLRNELAVAALVLHRWDVYEYNNAQFTHLYRLLTKDDSVEKIYAQQRVVQTNLSVSVALLVVVALFFIVHIYIIYFRRRVLFRFNVMQVLEVNRAMLRVMDRYDGVEQIDGWMPQLLAVVLGGIRELHEVSGVSILLRRTDGSRIGVFSQGQIPNDLIMNTLLLQACDQENAVFDNLSNSRSYALLLNVSGGNKVCIGALALHYGAYKMQPEDLVFEGYVVTYLSIQLYETIIQRGMYRDSVEVAENERQRALYEATRLRVQNQILDNCLSTVKHESMFYPSRIRQIIRTMDRDMTDGEWSERLASLRDVAEFYREIYVLLCAQADRQVETGCFRCEALPARRVAGRWVERQQRRAKRVRLSVAFVHEADGCVHADGDLLDFMLELIGDEWARRLEAREPCGERRLALEVADEDGFFRFAFCTPEQLYTEAESRELFQPDQSRYVYLLCKEIVREQDKLNNFCGCRIYAESLPETGCRIWFTLPKIKKDRVTDDGTF